jgi:hypothetical protein
MGVYDKYRRIQFRKSFEDIVRSLDEARTSVSVSVPSPVFINMNVHKRTGKIRDICR